ncbi:hypothetical protein ScPMuIL_009929 [Solemya velum]
METDYGEKESEEISIQKYDCDQWGSTSGSQTKEKGNLQKQGSENSSQIAASYVRCTRCEQQHCSYKEENQNKCEHCETQVQKCTVLQRQNSKAKPDNCDSKSGNSQNGCTDYANCQTKTKREKSIMVRVRRGILLLVLIAGCGAFLITQDRSGDIGHQEISHLLQAEFQKDVKLQAVSKYEFERQLAHAKGFRDVFKIFLSDKNLSNSEVDSILRSRTLDSYLSRMTREDQYYNDEGDRFDEILAEQAFANYREMEDHPMGSCHYPQPEIVQVRAPGKQYLPSCTILHRCRNVSGCCGDDAFECAVDSIEIVEKAFMVIGFEEDAMTMTEDSVESKSFINHTRCKCIEKKGLERCDKKCPHPYDLTRAGTRCHCECPLDNIRCKKILSGRKHLHERELQCIKEKKCYLPTCDYGDFDVKTGYCPKIRHHHRGRS